MYSTHQRRGERASIVEWAANDNYTHAITLNADRELSSRRLRDIFSTFCHRFDRETHRVRNMGRFPTELRFKAIVFPENLETNAHLHGFADFRPALSVIKNEALLEERVRKIWLASNRGAGSVWLKPNPDAGWGRYSTKRDHRTYMLAADFWPN